MKLTAEWISAAPTQAVCRMLTNAGYKACFVGGCVRNSLLGAPVNDIDIATDARPEVVMTLAKAAGMKPIPTGVEHGTVTVVAQQSAFEITTFRKDVETHGRHATVAFSDNIQDDARRRDFTMNALYALPDGSVIDPLDGLKDLHDRKVRFIEDADQRIQEDYLRILRFFRFHAWYGDPSGGLDADGLAAVAENVDGLGALSRERVGAELKKLLAAPDPVQAVAAMRMSGVLAAILPGADDQFLGPLVHLETQTNTSPNPIRRLAALGGIDLMDRLRLSKSEARQLVHLQDAMCIQQEIAETGYKHGVETGRDILLLRAALQGVGMSPDFVVHLKRGANARFPVQAKDLMHRYQGAELGVKLRALEAEWIKSGFSLGRDDLI